MFRRVISYLSKQFTVPDIAAGMVVNPFYLNRRPLYDKIQEMVASTDTESVLDIGCGRKPYEHLFKGKTYVGIDVEHSGHNHASSNVDKYYDGLNIPYSDNSFDMVFSTQVFEHVEELDELMLEVRRVLKPGGLLLVTMPFVWPEHEMPFDYRRYTSVGIVNWLGRHQVTILTCDKVGDGFTCFGALISNEIFVSIPFKNKYLKLAFWMPLGVVINIAFSILSLFFGSNNPALYTDIAITGAVEAKP